MNTYMKGRALIAPTGTPLDGTGWQDMSSRITLDGFDQAPAHDPMESQVWACPPTVWQEFTMPALTPRAFRLIFGMSRKQYRIHRGIERKQLIHNGKKPRR